MDKIMDLILLIYGTHKNGKYRENLRIFYDRQKAKSFIDKKKNKTWTDYSIYSCDMVEHKTKNL